MERDIMIIFTTCNNCGEITSLVSLDRKDDNWSWFNGWMKDEDKNIKVTSHDSSLIPCCGTSPNPCITTHTVTKEDLEKLPWLEEKMVEYASVRYMSDLRKEDFI
tara:strand:+ start:1376 stop:1690 length:315 start_codon:yes stop_codon:yes gene_type:complete